MREDDYRQYQSTGNSTLRRILRLSDGFVVHSLRHTMLTRLGESGADVLTIMRIAGHSSVTNSQRRGHPSPESLERAFERLATLNRAQREVPTASTTAGSEPNSKNPANRMT